MKLADMGRIDTMLCEEIEELKSKRFKIKSCSNVALRKAKEKEMDATIIIKDSSCVGFCHANIISESCHNLNPSACSTWLGFETFHEVKLHMKSYFGVESTQVQLKVFTKTGELTCVPREISMFEQILMVKIFMHPLSHETKLGDV